jgi:hypothetical protein
VVIAVTWDVWGSGGKIYHNFILDARWRMAVLQILLVSFFFEIEDAMRVSII